MCVAISKSPACRFHHLYLEPHTEEYFQAAALHENPDFLSYSEISEWVLVRDIFQPTCMRELAEKYGMDYKTCREWSHRYINRIGWEGLKKYDYGKGFLRRAARAVQGKPEKKPEQKITPTIPWYIPWPLEPVNGYQRIR